MREGLARHAVTVGSMTLLSRILGFVRDMFLARYFGAGLGMDAFFIAFKIPNFLRRLFAEGAFSLAFVPVLSEYKTQRDAVTVRALVDRVAGHERRRAGRLVARHHRQMAAPGSLVLHCP